ncbi:MULTISPECIES: DegV family protein [Bacillus]|uniref:DegV family protein n=1 Tax=Bacillus TaxID=1386 RepID=UPI0003130AE4|nr:MULTISPECIES: DegV family protein [Bacillus]
MNEKVAWVTDSTGFLDEELKYNEDLYVIPIQIHIEGKDYNDGIDITNADLYQVMEERKAIVTTSQPSVGQFTHMYDSLHKQKYERVYSFLISEKLSGTVSSSIQASHLVQIPVTTFDSWLLSYPMTYIMKKAISWQRQGDQPEEIIRKAKRLRNSNETYVLIGSLEQLHRSGRLNSLQYFLGNILKIKPIISLLKGKLEIQDIARNDRHTDKIIFKKLQHAVEQYQISECLILYGQSIKQSEKWVEKIKHSFPQLKVHIYPLGTAIGVHAGGNTIGISWFKEKI